MSKIVFSVDSREQPTDVSLLLLRHYMEAVGSFGDRRVCAIAAGTHPRSDPPVESTAAISYKHVYV